MCGGSTAVTPQCCAFPLYLWFIVHPSWNFIFIFKWKRKNKDYIFFFSFPLLVALILFHSHRQRWDCCCCFFFVFSYSQQSTHCTPLLCLLQMKTRNMYLTRRSSLRPPLSLNAALLISVLPPSVLPRSRCSLMILLNVCDGVNVGIYGKPQAVKGDATFASVPQDRSPPPLLRCSYYLVARAEAPALKGFADPLWNNDL